MVVFDSWALIAFLRNEPAAEQVEGAWTAEDVTMCSINLGEVLYLETRRLGSKGGAAAIKPAQDELTVVDPDWDLVSAAAGLKARGGLSYADAFCVATAQRLDAPVLTGDPEIVALAGEVEVVDLRAT